MSESYKAQLEIILDNMADGVLIVDDEGTIESYNKACELIFGYTADEMIGKNIGDLLPSFKSNPYEIKNFGGNNRTAKIYYEFIASKKNGTLFPVEFSGSEIRLDGRRIYNAIIRDITERKKYEYELKRSNQELEQFAYIASHDLKAPLRGIDNLAKWVIEDTGAEMPQDAREKLGLLRDRVARLENLLSGILLFSRAGRGEQIIEEVDIHQLLRELEQTHIPEKFKLELPLENVVFKTARIALEQVFGNLFSNAVKHHDKGGGVINVLLEPGDKFHTFRVKDDGPGIPPEFHGRVFQMFQTLQPRDNVDGSGLGMAIVKKLIEHQGGTVKINSEESVRGTEIEFTWPSGL